MYDVMICGNCIHEKKFMYEMPCKECSIVYSESRKTNHFEENKTKAEINSCKDTGILCDYGICSECEDRLK